jgi:hypothetical protein
MPIDRVRIGWPPPTLALGKGKGDPMCADHMFSEIEVGRVVRPLLHAKIGPPDLQVLPRTRKAGAA